MLPKILFRWINAAVFVAVFAQATACGQAPATAAGRATAPASTAGAAGVQTYAEWISNCRKLPPNRSLRGRPPSKDVLPIKEFREFDAVLTAFLEQGRNGALKQATNWVGASPEADGFFDIHRAYFQKPQSGAPALRFQPFAQKVSVPENSEIFFRGDLHGDVHSLLTDLEWLNAEGYLKGFDIARTNFYMVFLGDYTDRGLYGTEVLYTAFRLKLANPDRVFMARGNHEDLSLQLRYGYMQEGRAKYGAAFNLGKISRAYDFLPVVIYLESSGNSIQCNHGGMEPGYNPRSLLEADGPMRVQLLGRLKQQEFYSKNKAWSAMFNAAARDLAQRAFLDFEPEDPVSPMVLGFMWNDFSVLSSEPQFVLDPQRAFIFGEAATQYILQSASSGSRKVHAVFRAHQHSSQLTPVMRRLVASSGVYRHWQSGDSPALLEAAPQELKKHLETSESRPIPTGSVWTFNVAPDSAYGEGCGFAFDTFGILKTAAAFENWRLRVVNVNNPQ